MSNVASTLLPFFGNNVGGFGNNVERNFVLSTKSKQIEHIQFVLTLSKGRNFTIESFDIVAVCSNKVECCFDNVAGVDGASVRPPFYHTEHPPLFTTRRAGSFATLRLIICSRFPYLAGT